MAEDDDDSFGDFTFASSSSFNTHFTPPPKSNEDDEWGDFIEYPSGSEPSTAPSLTQSKPLDPFTFSAESPSKSEKTTGWVKPSGALPLSLFGEEDLEEQEKENQNKPAEDNTNTKVRNGSSNANLGFGFDSVISNLYNQNHNLKSENGSLSSNSNDLRLDPNWRSPTVSRVQSLNYLASLNEDSQQIKTEATGSSVSANAVSSSNFSIWNLDFDTSKSNQNGLNGTSSNDQGLQIKTKTTELGFDSNKFSSSSANFASSTFGTCGLDLDMSKSNPDGLNRTVSLDGLTNLNDQIKTESGGLVPNSVGSGSPILAANSTFSGWNFDFGGFESAVETSNSKASPSISSNLDFNAVGPSEKLHGTHENNDGDDDDDDDDEDDGWEFKDAYSMSTVGDGSNKATSEAEEGHENKALSFDLQNGLSSSVDFFASNVSETAGSKLHHAGDTLSHSSGFCNSLSGTIDLFATTNQPIDLFVTSSDGKVEQKDSNGAPDPLPIVGNAEPDEDFGEFTEAFADSGLKLEEEWKGNDVAHTELQASEPDINQVKESKLENHKRALPLSLFGDEELEIDGSSNVEDISVPQPVSYPKNDRSSNSNISINDLISNLYSQAEQISPVHSVHVPNGISVSPPHDSVPNSNLVNGEDDLDDGEWEFKDGSSQMGMDNSTSLLTSEDSQQRCSSNLNLDNYLDFYSKLRNELYNHAKCLLDNLKRGQSIDGLTVEEAKVSTLSKEIEEACKDIDLGNAMCKGEHEEGRLSHNACVSTFIDILQEPTYQVLESEYNLSRRLSLVEDDLETTVDVIRHATMMLKILRSGSLEEQSIYVSVWHKMISVCAQELQHGCSIWNKTLEMNAQSHVLSHPRGRPFIMALGEIYRVAVVVEASVKLCKPWTWLNSGPSASSMNSLLDECHTMWSSSGLGEALLESASSEDASFVTSLLDSLKLIRGVDALTLQKHLFAQKQVCRLSLLTLEVLPGMKLIDWNGEHYFLTLANLWGNLISSDPPELPHLTFGW